MPGKQKNIRLDEISRMHIQMIKEARGLPSDTTAIAYALKATAIRGELDIEDVARVIRALTQAGMPDSFIAKVARVLE
jgi:hypothetical protein